ncbi:MAG: prepilin peptidase [Chloroflexi bacterium]|nr:prepilin peptidase [Chloroflexota bacterium]
MVAMAGAAAVPGRKADLRVALFASVMVAGGAVLGLRASDWQHAAVLTLGLGLLTWAGCIDLRSMRAPNAITYPAAAAVTLAAFALGTGDGLDALAGGAAAFALLLAAAIAGRGAMGFGDVKYGFTCGALVGIHALVPALLFAFGGGALYALVLMLLRLRSRKDVLAFTPFLALGVLGALAVTGGYLGA